MRISERDVTYGIVLSYYLTLIDRYPLNKRHLRTNFILLLSSEIVVQLVLDPPCTEPESVPLGIQ